MVMLEKIGGLYARFHDGFGIGELNEEEKSILEFPMTYDFKTVNTCFKKRKKHLITYKSKVSTLQTKFISVRNMDKRIFKDCKVKVKA